MKNEIAEIEKQALTIDNQAKEISIRSQENYDKANEFLKVIRAFQTKIKETFRPIIEQAYATHKEAVNKEKMHLEPLIRAEAFVKNKMLDYIREQERIRQEAEKKLQVEAEKKRQEALEKAETARAEGKEAKAEKYEDKASQIIAPILASTVDKGGVSIRKIYRAEVFNLFELVKTIAEGKAPLGLVEANMAALNAQARSLKESMNYPGVKVVVEDTLTSARR